MEGSLAYMIWSLDADVKEHKQPWQAIESVISPDDRLVISGASGWMGKSLIFELSKFSPEFIREQMLAVGSHRRRIHIFNGLEIEIAEWNQSAISQFEPTIAVHLAFLTIDRLKSLTMSDYSRTNAELTEKGLALQSVRSLRAFMAASSGAATLAGTNAPLGRHPYSIQKSADESAFLSSPSAAETPTLIPRIWSVSGQFCTKPKNFAFTDFVTRSILGETIEVNSQGAVYRRYVDAGEFLVACLAHNLSGANGVIDSAGPLIEIRELAYLVAAELGGKVRTEKIDSEMAADNYYSESDAMQVMAQVLGIRFTDLLGQIRRTANGFKVRSPSSPRRDAVFPRVIE